METWQGCPTCGNTDAATLRAGAELYGEDPRIVSCLRCLGDAYRLPLDGDSVGQRRRAFEVETAARTWRPAEAPTAAAVIASATTPQGVEVVTQNGRAVREGAALERHADRPQPADDPRRGARVLASW